MGTQEKKSKPGGAPDTPGGEQDQAKGKTEAKAGLQQEESHTCCGCRFPLLVALLQLTLGVTVTVLAFIMSGSCSSLLIRDTPHWAGIIVSLVAVLGLFLLCLSYQPEEKTACQFAMKMAYFLLSSLGMIICVMAVAFAAYHYSLITQFTCEASAGSCHCTLDSLDPLSRSFLYEDVVDCATVTTTTKLFVMLQMSLNLLLALVCLAACFVMWKDRYQVFYVGLRVHGSATNNMPPQKFTHDLDILQGINAKVTCGRYKMAEVAALGAPLLEVQGLGLQTGGGGSKLKGRQQSQSYQIIRGTAGSVVGISTTYSEMNASAHRISSKPHLQVQVCGFPSGMRRVHPNLWFLGYDFIL
ncbi:sarcospan [Pelodytes ibericus]